MQKITTGIDINITIPNRAPEIASNVSDDDCEGVGNISLTE